MRLRPVGGVAESDAGANQSWNEQNRILVGLTGERTADGGKVATSKGGRSGFSTSSAASGTESNPSRDSVGTSAGSGSGASLLAWRQGHDRPLSPSLSPCSGLSSSGEGISQHPSESLDALPQQHAARCSVLVGHKQRPNDASPAWLKTRLNRRTMVARCLIRLPNSRRYAT